VLLSLGERLPTAEKYGEDHMAMHGVVSGMAVMALSRVLFTGWFPSALNVWLPGRLRYPSVWVA